MNCGQNLAECERLGMQLAPFARSKGMHPQRLSWWKTKLARTAKSPRPAPAAQLIPVRVPEPRTTSSQPPIHDAHFELVMPREQVLRIPQHFAPDALLKIIATLEAAR